MTNTEKVTGDFEPFSIGRTLNVSNNQLIFVVLVVSEILKTQKVDPFKGSPFGLSIQVDHQLCTNPESC